MFVFHLAKRVAGSYETREVLISRGSREPLHLIVGHFIVSITVPMASEMRIAPIFHEIHFDFGFPGSTARPDSDRNHIPVTFTDGKIFA